MNRQPIIVGFSSGPVGIRLCSEENRSIPFCRTLKCKMLYHLFKKQSKSSFAISTVTENIFHLQYKYCASRPVANLQYTFLITGAGNFISNRDFLHLCTFHITLTVRKSSLDQEDFSFSELDTSVPDLLNAGFSFGYTNSKLFRMVLIFQPVLICFLFHG